MTDFDRNQIAQHECLSAASIVGTYPFAGSLALATTEQTETQIYDACKSLGAAGLQQFLTVFGLPSSPVAPFTVYGRDSLDLKQIPCPPNTCWLPAWTDVRFVEQGFVMSTAISVAYGFLRHRQVRLLVICDQSGQAVPGPHIPLDLLAATKLELGCYFQPGKLQVHHLACDVQTACRLTTKAHPASSGV